MHDLHGIGVNKAARQTVQVVHGQQVQVVHKFAQAQHVLSQRERRLMRKRAHAVHQGFHFTAQAGQRCAQLVRHVGNPAPARTFHALKALGHEVDVARQITNFVTSCAGHTHAELAMRDARRSVLHIAQRFGPAPRQPPRQQQRRGHQEHSHTGDALALRMQKVHFFSARQSVDGAHAQQGHDAAVQQHRAFKQGLVARRQRAALQWAAIGFKQRHALAHAVNGDGPRWAIHWAIWRAWRWCRWPIARPGPGLGRHAFTPRHVAQHVLQMQPTVVQRAHAPGLAQVVGHHFGEQFQAGHVARQQVGRETLAQVPRHPHAHGQHAHAHSG